MNPRLIAPIALAFAGFAYAQTSPPAGSPRLATATPAAAESTSMPPMPAQLGLCAACHGVDGRSRTPGTPQIGGQDEARLRASLWAYRDGSRRAVAMNAISNALQPSDIDELARWYAAQPIFDPAAER